MTSFLGSSFFLMTALSLVSFGQNGNQRPLLVKINEPGYVIEDYYFGETCKLYRDRVEIEYRMRGHTLKEVKRLSGASGIGQLVQKAQQEKILETENFLCDGPSTTLNGMDKSGQEVLLYSTGGCGAPKKVREGGAAFALAQLMTQYCLKTY